MCWIVLVAVSAERSLQLTQQICIRHNLNSTPISNQSLPAKYRFFSNSTWCNCGTYIGRDVARDAEHLSLRQARGRKKNWSQTRIDKWAAQKESARERLETKHRLESAAEFQSWRSMFGEFIANGIYPIGFIKHFFESPLPQDPINLDQISVQSLSSFDDLHFSSSRPNILYLFEPGE